MGLIDRLFPDLVGFGSREKPAPRKLQEMSEAAVQALYVKAGEKRDKIVAKVIKDSDPDWLRPAVMEHVIKAQKARRKLKTDDLKRIARLGRKLGQPAVQAETDKLKLKSTPAWESMMRGHNPDVAHTHRGAFGDKDRLYFDLPQADDHPTGHELAIRHWLDREGYTDVDYTDGKVTAPDGTRMRIGRALGERPDLLRVYSDDPGRARDKLMVVISRDPVDVARMSTGRGWASCMERDGEYAHYLPTEVAGGTVIAYLARKSDPELNDPLGRMLLKPHVEQMYRTVTMIPYGAYGIGHPGLADVVWQFAKERFSQPDGPAQYDLARGLYNDGYAGSRVVLPPGKLSAEQVLRALMVPFEKDEAGKITVNGGINLDNMGLTELPDFSDVTVKGFFSCTGNRLSSLKGAPAEVTLFFNASNNRLVTLEGMPKKIGRWIRLRDNQLTSLEGCPEHVQGTFDVSNNPLVTLEGSPRTIGHEFSVHNTLLDSWEGGPESVGLEVHARNTAIRDEDGAPEAGMGVMIDQPVEPIHADGPRY